MKQIAQQLQFVANTKSESRDLACAKALKLIDDRSKSRKSGSRSKNSRQKQHNWQRKKRGMSKNVISRNKRKGKKSSIYKKEQDFSDVNCCSNYLACVAISIYLSNQHEKRLQNAEAAV
jgi:hypothetical protein